MTVLFLVATVVAVGALAYAWHVGRDERRRGEARVAALAAAIDGSAVAEPAAGTAPGAMFARDADSVVQRRPLFELAIGFCMAVLVIVVIAMSLDRHEPATRQAAAAAGAPAAQPLELLSMRHDRRGADLTVTGLVRNPGPLVQGDIMAVVLAFDRDGQFVASAHAPLEFGRIAGGDESPFRVTIPGLSEVGRYRVSFRTSSGVVRHVDRREDVVSGSVAAHTSTRQPDSSSF